MLFALSCWSFLYVKRVVLSWPGLGLIVDHLYIPDEVKESQYVPIT